MIIIHFISQQKYPYFINIENFINHLFVQNIIKNVWKMKILDLEILAKSGNFCMQKNSGNPESQLNQKQLENVYFMNLKIFLKNDPEPTN